MTRVIFSLLALARPAGAETWKHELSKNGIEVSSRAVDGSKVRELRAVTTMAASVERIQSVLDDVESYPGRMPPTTEVQKLATDRYYMVIDPGFIARRDYCFEMKREKLDGGAQRISWHDVVAGCPAPKKHVRIVRNVGSWTLTPVENGTQVVYQSHTDPAGDVPCWLMNLAAPRKLPEIVGALRKTVLETRPAATRGLRRYAQRRECAAADPGRAMRRTGRRVNFSTGGT